MTSNLNLNILKPEQIIRREKELAIPPWVIYQRYFHFRPLNDLRVFVRNFLHPKFFTLWARAAFVGFYCFESDIEYMVRPTINPLIIVIAIWGIISSLNPLVQLTYKTYLNDTYAPIAMFMHGAGYQEIEEFLRSPEGRFILWTPSPLIPDQLYLDLAYSTQKYVDHLHYYGKPPKEQGITQKKYDELLKQEVLKPSGVGHKQLQLWAKRAVVGYLDDMYHHDLHRYQYDSEHDSNTVSNPFSKVLNTLASASASPVSGYRPGKTIEAYLPTLDSFPRQEILRLRQYFFQRDQEAKKHADTVASNFLKIADKKGDLTYEQAHLIAKELKKYMIKDVKIHTRLQWKAYQDPDDPEEEFEDIVTEVTGGYQVTRQRTKASKKAIKRRYARELLEQDIDSAVLKLNQSSVLPNEGINYLLKQVAKELDKVAEDPEERFEYSRKRRTQYVEKHTQFNGLGKKVNFTENMTAIELLLNSAVPSDIYFNPYTPWMEKYLTKMVTHTTKQFYRFRKISQEARNQMVKNMQQEMVLSLIAGFPDTFHHLPLEEPGVVDALMQGQHALPPMPQDTAHTSYICLPSTEGRPEMWVAQSATETPVKTYVVSDSPTQPENSNKMIEQVKNPDFPYWHWGRPPQKQWSFNTADEYAARPAGYGEPRVSPVLQLEKSTGLSRFQKEEANREFTTSVGVATQEDNDGDKKEGITFFIPKPITNNEESDTDQVSFPEVGNDTSTGQVPLPGVEEGREEEYLKKIIKQVEEKELEGDSTKHGEESAPKQFDEELKSDLKNTVEDSIFKPLTHSANGSDFTGYDGDDENESWGVIEKNILKKDGNEDSNQEGEDTVLKGREMGLNPKKISPFPDFPNTLMANEPLSCFGYQPWGRGLDAITKSTITGLTQSIEWRYATKFLPTRDTTKFIPRVVPHMIIFHWVSLWLWMFIVAGLPYFRTRRWARMFRKAPTFPVHNLQPQYNYFRLRYTRGHTADTQNGINQIYHWITMFPLRKLYLAVSRFKWMSGRIDDFIHYPFRRMAKTDFVRVIVHCADYWDIFRWFPVYLVCDFAGALLQFCRLNINQIYYFFTHLHSTRPNDQNLFIFVGTSGSGKTFLAKCIAGECRVNLFSLNAVALLHRPKRDQGELTRDEVSGDMLPLVISKLSIRKLHRFLDCGRAFHRASILLFENFDKMFYFKSEKGAAGRTIFSEYRRFLRTLNHEQPHDLIIHTTSSLRDFSIWDLNENIYGTTVWLTLPSLEGRVNILRAKLTTVYKPGKDWTDEAYMFAAQMPRFSANAVAHIGMTARAYLAQNHPRDGIRALYDPHAESLRTDVTTEVNRIIRHQYTQWERTGKIPGQVKQRMGHIVLIKDALKTTLRPPVTSPLPPNIPLDKTFDVSPGEITWKRSKLMYLDEEDFDRIIPSRPWEYPRLSESDPMNPAGYPTPTDRKVFWHATLEDINVIPPFAIGRSASLVNDSFVPFAKQLLEDSVLPEAAKEAKDIFDEKILPRAKDVLDEKILPRVKEAKDVFDEKILPRAKDTKDIVQEKILPSMRKATDIFKEKNKQIRPEDEDNGPSKA